MTAPEFTQPHDEAAERAFLGAAMTGREPGAVRGAVEAMTETAFYFPKHAAVFRAVRSLFDNGADSAGLIVVLDALKLAGELDEAGGVVCISGLVDEGGLVAEMPRYAEIIRRHARMREVREAAQHVLDRTTQGDTDPEQAASWLAQKMQAPASGAEGRGGFNPRPLEDILATVPEAVPWIVPGLLAPGRVTMIAGSPKLGKSTFAAHAVRSVVFGQPFLGAPTRKASVTWLACEEHEDDFAARFRALGLVSALHASCGPQRADPGTILAIKAHLLKQSEPRVLVVDSLSRFWLTKDENDARQSDAALAPVVGLARETDTAILLIHHARKSAEPSPDAFRGSSDILASVEIGVVLSKRPADAQEGLLWRRLLTTFSRLPGVPERVLVELVGGEAGVYERLGSPEEMAAADLERAILDELRDHGEPIAEKDIPGLVHASKGRVIRAVKALGERGAIGRRGSGVSRDPKLVWRTAAPAGGAL